VGFAQAANRVLTATVAGTKATYHCVVELSDEKGSLVKPTKTYTLTATSGTAFAIAIPDSLPAGTYQIRITPTGSTAVTSQLFAVKNNMVYKDTVNITSPKQVDSLTVSFVPVFKAASLQATVCLSDSTGSFARPTTCADATVQANLPYLLKIPASTRGKAFKIRVTPSPSDTAQYAGATGKAFEIQQKSKPPVSQGIHELQGEYGTVDVFSANGILLWSGQSEEEIPKLQAGVYFVRCGNVTRKVVIK
jgi:hypothetical protein